MLDLRPAPEDGAREECYGIPFSLVLRILSGVQFRPLSIHRLLSLTPLLGALWGLSTVTPEVSGASEIASTPTQDS